MTSSVGPCIQPDALFEEIRAREFSLLEATGLVYLDYTGAALPARSHLRALDALAVESVFGNPHAEHGPSRASTEAIAHAREEVLRFLDADPTDYAVCFTASATAAAKLVAESFPFRRGSRLAIPADNHNSINGIREYARRGGGEVRVLPLTSELRLDDAIGRLAGPLRRGKRLFAFPAQSNFSGVRHSLSLVTEAQRLGYAVLLDAAAYVPSAPLSLRVLHPDFVVLSFYKMFGVPTGVGALLVRRDALSLLRRPWFSGGTVDWVSVRHGRHRLHDGIEAFEDGTPNYLGIASLAAGFDFIRSIGIDRLSAHVQMLTGILLDALTSLHHSDGKPMVDLYGPGCLDNRGGTVAFNLRDSRGIPIPCEEVGLRASRANIALRCGCFCNPGAAEAAFAFPQAESLGCLESVSNRGFTLRRFADCLGGDVPVGAVRASVGMATNRADVDRVVEELRKIASSTGQ